jgi:CBS domain containing-hemolysin-like protein
MAIKTAIKDFTPSELEEEFSKSTIHFFVIKKLGTLFSSKTQTHSPTLKDFLNLCSSISYIIYGTSGAIFLISNDFFREGIQITHSAKLLISLTWAFSAIFFLLCIALCFYFLLHFFATHAKIATLKLFSFFSSIYAIVLFPLVYPVLWLEKKLSPTSTSQNLTSSSQHLKKRLLDLLEEAERQNLFDPMEKKLVSSIAQFGDLVAREIMVPRPDMLCLPEKATVYESLKLFIQEGYSRIPLFSESIDDITSVLLYKDVMEFCVNCLEKNSLDEIKTTFVSTLSGEILFSPENKKIRDLFSEMRTKKIHSAIVVNEYGCTEGLITIEDILEELVGSEIRDEHDVGEEILYKETTDKSWIVDATMSIIDVEKELGIELPHGPEYETIAGFISLQARSIPKPGTIVHGENFHIEVLKSDERQIIEVKITPEKSERLDL